MSVEDSESRRFELTFGCVFLRAILVQHLPRIVFFFVFSKNFSLELFFGRFVLERYTKRIAGIIEIQSFLVTSRFHYHRSYPAVYLVGHVFAQGPIS